LERNPYGHTEYRHIGLNLSIFCPALLPGSSDELL
jgi:hypothetical protein